MIWAKGGLKTPPFLLLKNEIVNNMKLQIESKEQDSYLLQIQVNEDTSLGNYKIINLHQKLAPSFIFPDVQVRKFDTVQVFSCSGLAGVSTSQSGIKTYSLLWPENEEIWKKNLGLIQEYRIVENWSAILNDVWRKAQLEILINWITRRYLKNC